MWIRWVGGLLCSARQSGFESRGMNMAILVEETLATKADLLVLKADVAELKTDITKWNMALMVSMTGIFAAIVKIF